MQSAIASGKISGDGVFTRKCHEFFEQKLGFEKVLLTTSCTDALELSALLCDIQPGDEVIAPSFTFVSTVNAFALRGAKIVFADSEVNTPNMDVAHVEQLITPRTRVIVPVHYAGVACDMDKILSLAAANNIVVVEDAAQAIDSYYKGKTLGTLGDMGTFSFHETKNIIAGEGGLLAINDPQYIARAEILREKGTNRSAFFRGEVDKYSWVDVGSSFLPSDLLAAYLYAQLEQLSDIQQRRKHLWSLYAEGLAPLAAQGIARLPFFPDYASNNAHIFYLVCKNIHERTALIEHLKSEQIMSVFHYVALHSSPYFEAKYEGAPLPNADIYTDCLLRLPLFYELSETDIVRVVDSIQRFYGVKKYVNHQSTIPQRAVFANL